MIIRRLALLLSFIVSTVGSLASAGTLEMESIPVGESAPVWQGPQFVQADRAGNVFFFRGDTLAVYPVTKTGTLGEPTRLEATAEAGGLVHDAVLSPGGDQWLVYSDFSVRRFVNGKEKPVAPLDWNPWAVGFLRNTPVVAVIPRPMGRVRDLEKITDVPWFMTLGSDRWDLLTRLTGVSVSKLRGTGGMNDVIAENAVYLTSDRQGKLWAARQYAYRVERFSPGGRVLLEIIVDRGEVRRKKESKGIEVKLHGENGNPSDATRNPKTETATYFSFSAEPVIRDLTEGRDGRMYFLVRLAEGGMALDRYDPTRSVLERASLSLKAEGVLTMAAGRDALYIAAWRGDQGRWRVSWDRLEQVEWKGVEGAEIDGFAPEAPATAPGSSKAAASSGGR